MADEYQLRQLRNDIYLWMFFCLADKDFRDALLSAYPKEMVDREIDAVLALIKNWMNNKNEL